jgi:hypothetical protein
MLSCAPINRDRPIAAHHIFHLSTKPIFASFALFAVKKIMHRKGRKERKVFGL